MILDYKLPDVNGNIVCQTVRADPEYEQMKILLISGVADPDEVQELLDAGANDFIKKPFEIHHVIDRIAQMVGL
jgi:DNA-binding response OmpR family regulator